MFFAAAIAAVNSVTLANVPESPMTNTGTNSTPYPDSVAAEETQSVWDLISTVCGCGLHGGDHVVASSSWMTTWNLGGSAES